MSTPVRLQRLAEVAPDQYRVPAEKLIAGDPLQTLWMQYADPDGRFFAGVWQSEPGKWRIAYTEDEYCHLLEGQSIVTDADGHATPVSAGDRFVIPRGFAGTWEVVATTRKHFVIHEPRIEDAP